MKLSAEVDGFVAPGKANLVTVEVRAFKDTPVERVKAMLGPVERVLCGPTVMTAGAHVFTAPIVVPDRLPPSLPLVVEVDERRAEQIVPVAMPGARDPASFSPHDPVIGPLWARVAAELRLEPRGHTLVTRAGSVVARLQLEHRMVGPSLVARLSYPSLGLDLLVGANGGRGVARGEQVQHTFAVWGSAREARQAAYFLRHLGTLLDQVIVSRVDDTSATIETLFRFPNYALIKWFAARAVALAAAVDAARGWVPAPMPMRAYVSGWTALANELESTLSAIDLSIAGRWRGAEVRCDMAYQLGGFGTAMRIAVRPAGGVRAKAVVLDDPDVWSAAWNDEEIVVDVKPPFEGHARVLGVIRRLVELGGGEGVYR